MLRVMRVSGAYFVFAEDDAHSLYWGRYFGRPLGSAKPKPEDKLSPLKLSKHEVLYLQERREIRAYDGDSEVRVPAPRGRQLLAYRVYKDLRDRGFVVRSGLKFGATFACYERGPGIDHAPFLVQVVSADTKLSGIEVIRAGRLSHGIRKNFVFATADKEKGAVYLTLSWVRA
ncbi:MAG: tRNA-intron lyase [Thermoprotei archaeon]